MPHEYGGYRGSAPRIAMVLTPLDEKNLRLAVQLGVTDIVFYGAPPMRRRRCRVV